ncbi:MAG TPA: dihydrofolate reductase [Legionella sp.]|nr:dihydrofolate reductase [Legionella sp.]
MISLIAAVDENRGMGKNNQLLCHLPADLKYFKQHTLGKPIIMGRKTFDSIGRALPGRLNIVLSQQKQSIVGVTVVDSLQEALHLAQPAPEIMVIGGANVFEQALPLTQRIYLTMIHHPFDADVFFPELDASIWRLGIQDHREHDEKNPYDMTFCQYERI